MNHYNNQHLVISHGEKMADCPVVFPQGSRLTALRVNSNIVTVYTFVQYSMMIIHEYPNITNLKAVNKTLKLQQNMATSYHVFHVSSDYYTLQM